MTAPFDAEWLDRTRRLVSDRADTLVDRVATTPEQAKLLHTALEQLRARATERAPVTSVHLPLLIIAAIRGSNPESDDDIGMALVTSLLELGVDLLDDLADRELEPRWTRVDPATVQLAATGFLCSLPQIAIGELTSPPDRVAAMHDCLARGFVAIGAGQQLDLELVGNADPSLDTVTAAVEGKTGERRALYAELAAVYSGCSDEERQSHHAFGRELGIALQLANDLHDLFSAEDSRDIAHGARTWPVVWTLSTMEATDRPDALSLLRRAETDTAARRECRALLRRRGALFRTVLQIERHKRRALQALERTEPREPAGQALREMIAAVCPP